MDSRAEFQAEHIPGAINIPSDELETRAEDELQGASHIVVYCRCPSDGAAVSALDLLNKNGFDNVSVLKGGFNAWKSEAAMPPPADSGRQGRGPKPPATHSNGSS